MHDCHHATPCMSEEVFPVPSLQAACPLIGMTPRLPEVTAPILSVPSAGVPLLIWGVLFREAIQSNAGVASRESCPTVSEVEEVAAELPTARPGKVLDYGSDSDLPVMRGDTLARRRSLYHLRDSRRRGSLTRM